jgi:hypothetical protein
MVEECDTDPQALMQIAKGVSPRVRRSAGGQEARQK